MMQQRARRSTVAVLAGAMLVAVAVGAGTLQPGHAQTGVQNQNNQNRPNARTSPSQSSRPSPFRPDLRPNLRPDPRPKQQPPRPPAQPRPQGQQQRSAVPDPTPLTRSSPVVLQPPQRAWGPGGPVASGAALGSMPAGLAVSVAGPAPANGMCWYYKTPDRRVGFWDKCS